MILDLRLFLFCMIEIKRNDCCFYILYGLIIMILRVVLYGYLMKVL